MATEWRRPTEDTGETLGEESLFPNVVAFRVAYHISNSGLRLNADEPYYPYMITRRMKRDPDSLPYWITPLL